LFQKVSEAIKASISLARCCKAGKSKKPPQMREFVRRGAQLLFNDIKHSARSVADGRSGWEDGNRRRFQESDAAWTSSRDSESTHGTVVDAAATKDATDICRKEARGSRPGSASVSSIGCKLFC
jgi:hypothetical protein